MPDTAQLLDQWFSTESSFAPQPFPADIWQCLETYWDWKYKLKWGVIRTCSGQRPGMLLHTLQRTGQPPTTGTHLTQNVKVQKPCLDR